MRRGRALIRDICSHKNMLVQPYAGPLTVSANYLSIDLKSNIQNLPHLPVPKLHDTLNKYLKTVRPHLNDEQFAITSTLVKNFAVEGGIGWKLQELLQKRAAEHQNWLEEWWLNTAYLDFRSPVVVHSNPGLVFPFRKFNSTDDQLKYAAQTLLAALDYKYLIDKNEIPIEMIGKHQLDMSQYKKIFGTCRVPGLTRDTISYNDTNYITVIHNKHIFHVDLFGNDGKMLNEAQIVQQLKSVLQMSQKPSSKPMGILTSENRNVWGKTYQILVKDRANRSMLKDIESSLAVLCLDEACSVWKHSEKDIQQNLAAAQTIHGGGSTGNGANRWFDKTLQFIVGADGLVGLTYEHSPAEGQPIAILTDFIVNFIDNNKSDNRIGSANPIEPYRLEFNVVSDVENAIKRAEDNLDRLVEDLELNCFTYNKYGKNFIKSQKLSPDSYLQMAMQYAFFRLHKTPGAHYESAATRMYVGGRTETIRSCSIESIQFAKTMLDSKASPKDKLVAMQNAINSHKDYTVQALQGYGVDRHLLGLKLVAIENGIDIPKLYLDAGYVKSSHMRISTSQVACKCDGFMCYGPLVPDGYATCYNPRDNDINFATAAFVSHPDTSCSKYRQALEKSLQDMQDVLLLNRKSKL